MWAGLNIGKSDKRAPKPEDDEGGGERREKEEEKHILFLNVCGTNAREMCKDSFRNNPTNDD